MKTVRPIERGDIVQICFTDGEAITNAQVLRRPTNIGDCWEFQIEGAIMTINPMASNFSGVTRFDKEEDNETAHPVDIHEHS